MRSNGEHRLAARFPRIETRRRVGRFVLGLLADLPRKNCWSIAEHAGDRDPHGMQYLLARASWDTDGVRDDLRDYVVGALGDPQSWTADPQRLADAGVPDDIDFLTKPALAIGMLTRALHAGVPARWATGDEVYGNDPNLRAECETQRIGYVLAIGCDRHVRTPAGPQRADTLVAGLPRWAWQQLSAGAGAKGGRFYDWAWITLTPDNAASSTPTTSIPTRCSW